MLFLILPALYALSGEQIVSAEGEVLRNMAQLRGIPSEGDEEEVRKLIFEYEGLSYSSISLPEDISEDTYSLSIINADSLREEGEVILLEGNVVISLTVDGGEPKSLSASRVIIDSPFSRITALGNATYSDKAKDAPIQEIEADVFSLFYESGDLSIIGGTTMTERKNSDEKTVSFYTTGETLSYSDAGAMLYDKGYITSNPKEAYSSISASRIAILPGEDMFLSSAVFNIGRVPIFYIPFFFYPGSRILGNPSFGFSSTKGAFLNTTFEIFGSHPKIKDTEETNSFSSLLKSSSDQSQFVPNGFYYGENENPTSLSEWASSTSSYLSLMFDAYAGSYGNILPLGGINAALDTSLSFFGGKMKVNLLDGLAYSYPVSGNHYFRFYGVNNVELSGFGLSVKLNLPFYSDQYVMRDFGNRLTGFSISPLLGEETSFPQDYSLINSFDTSLTASWNLPSSYSTFLLSSAKISSLTIKEKKEFDSLSSTFLLSEKVSPSLSLSLSGKLISLSLGGKAEETAKEEKKEEKVGEAAITDPLLMTKYSFSQSQATVSSMNDRKVDIGLSWSLNGDYDDSETYRKGEKSGDSLTGKVGGKVKLDTTVGALLSFTDSLEPQYSIKKTGNVSTTNYRVVTKESTLLNNNFSLSVPVLGLSYTLNLRLISNNLTSTSNTPLIGEETVVTEEEDVPFSWSEESVKKHEVSLSKTLDTVLGKFTGKITYVIPPLTGTLSPSLDWKYGNGSASFKWVFKENEDKRFVSSETSLSLSYSSSFVSSIVNAKYIFQDGLGPFIKSDLSLSNSFSLFTKDKKWSFEEKAVYYPESKRGIENYFQSLSASFKADWLSGIFYFSSKDDGDIGFDRMTIKTALSSSSLQFWKGRVFLSLALNSSLDYYMEYRNKSMLTFQPTLIFSIAEFLDLKLSFTTENRFMGTYYDGDKFSWSMMLEDLRKSLDFLGEGRRNTHFIMKKINLEFVHVMEDWDLECRYSTELINNTIDGRTIYTLQPSLSVFLSWKTMPDLKVEENWKQVMNVDGVAVWEKI